MDSLEALLPGYSITHVPASRAGFAGEGLLLAVKSSRSYSVMDFASDDSSLWVTLSFAEGHHPLTFGVCYIPPTGSPKLRDIGLQERFAHVMAHAVAAKDLGEVFIGGDFNAHVCITEVDRHGHRLHDLCAPHLS